MKKREEDEAQEGRSAVVKNASDAIAVENEHGAEAAIDDPSQPTTVQQESNNQLQVPEGDIFCTKCITDGATSVLEKYFDKIDYERSHYACSRAYVCSLLARHMRQSSPFGIVVCRRVESPSVGQGKWKGRCYNCR